MAKQIRIVGGGLAGLTLGILLRREGVPVEIWDAGSYPRHRVCGEFISGRGPEILKQLNLRDFPARCEAGSVRFFNADRKSPVLRLPSAALSVNRAVLDQSLAIEFQREGGVLHLKRRWTESFASEGLVRATGRRLKTRGKSKGLVGLKVHATNLRLSADLELHFSDAGYVGLSRQLDGCTNICGLFRNGAGLREVSGDFSRLLAGVLGGGARDQLEKAKYETETFSAVAGISLQRESGTATKECRIGDSICMIAPMTGNGMSIALESAAIAAPFLRDFAGGHGSWAEAQQKISYFCDRAFRKRLNFAAFLQRVAFCRAGRAALLSMVQIFPGTLDWCFRRTR